MAYEVHPLAELIPPMTEEEFTDLVHGIESEGFRNDEPVVIYEDQILDGRHRYRASQQVGVEPPTRLFEGDDPVGYVISKNLHRRHLTKSQVAMTAAEALPHLEKEARKRAEDGRRRGGEEAGRGRPKASVPTGTEAIASADSKRAAAEAAELTGASARSVGRAKRVKEADPELAEQVKAGEVSLTRAEEVVSGKPNKNANTGLETKTDDAGRKQPATFFGRGDKWQESTEPLTRYLVAWGKRGYDFGHLNYREAAKRVKRIDTLIAGLEAARADLEPRSQRAKLTFDGRSS